jgi:hypothetical protein
MAKGIIASFFRVSTRSPSIGGSRLTKRRCAPLYNHPARGSFGCGLSCGFVVLVHVFNVKKMDLDRRLAVVQSLEIRFRRQSVLYLLLEIRFGLATDLQLSLQDLGLSCGFSWRSTSAPNSLSPSSIRSSMRVKPRLYRSNRAFASFNAALNRSFFSRRSGASSSLNATGGAFTTAITLGLRPCSSVPRRRWPNR